MVTQNLLSSPGGGEGSSPTDRPARSRRLHYRARPLGGATALRAPCGASAPNLGTEHPPVPLLNGPLGGVLSPSFPPPQSWYRCLRRARSMRFQINFAF